jgi:23S rRNA pseudouridine1911/1915/1917 synthase
VPAGTPPPVLDRVVADEEAGRRIDQLLAAWLDEPRSRVAERVARGDVTLGGRRVAKSRKVAAGDRVRVVAPPAAAPPQPPPPVPVRYADDDLLVVAKPAGLVVHPGAGTVGPTLVDALRAAGATLADVGDPGRPGIVHRLDRGTSGLLVVAASSRAARGLQQVFAAHDVTREYWALVEGVPDPPRATIDAPIARSEAQRTRFRVDAAGRHAVSHYDVVRPHGRCAQVRVRLETGRTHQVRVHLSAVGHPIVADTTYGAGPLGAQLGLDRPALHARRLAFAHPVTGGVIDLEEPLPADLRRAVAALGEGG